MSVYLHNMCVQYVIFVLGLCHMSVVCNMLYLYNVCVTMLSLCKMYHMYYNCHMGSSYITFLIYVISVRFVACKIIEMSIGSARLCND